jgi:hypothetical protein
MLVKMITTMLNNIWGTLDLHSVFGKNLNRHLIHKNSVDEKV